MLCWNSHIVIKKNVRKSKLYKLIIILVQEIYDKIDENNKLFPCEEFNNEPEGENELYTADSFK